MIGMTMIPLFYVKNYKAVLYSGLGLVVGLGIWSWWAYINSGNPLNWLFMRIESTVTSNEYYFDASNMWMDNLVVPFSALLQSFPFVLLFIWFKRQPAKVEIKKRIWFFLMGYITYVHWVFFFIAQFKIITYPDPRFFVLSLPITIVWFFSLFQRGYFRAFVTQRVVMLLLLVSLLQLVVPFYRSYSLQARKELGYWMKEHLGKNEVVWSDLAVAIVESDREAKLFFSSDRLVPKELRGTDEEAGRIKEILETEKIKYITSYTAPYDYTTIIWPEIKELKPFEWQDYSFVPVFSYAPYQHQEGTPHSYLRAKFEAPNPTSSIWKVYKN